MRILLVVVLSTLFAFASVQCIAPLNYNVHLFYYTWYGSEPQDSLWIHWNHTLLKTNGQVDLSDESLQAYRPPDSIAASSYPVLGPYSSKDREVLNAHLKWIAEMGVGVIAVSWWGHRANTSGDGQLQLLHRCTFTDEVLPILFEEAEKTDVKVAFHIEPYSGRTAVTLVEDIEYLIKKFGSSPALYRMVSPRSGEELPVFYVYDTYQIAVSQWADVLKSSIRRTASDAIVLSLLVDFSELDQFILPGGFDGFYSYFAVDQFTYGSSTSVWPSLVRLATQNSLIFSATVGPGYDDSPLRPWNTISRRGRQDGQYYRRMWDAALRAGPAIISITSWNEWGEGTQIEPALIKRKNYQSYASPNQYLDLTQEYVRRFSPVTAGKLSDELG